MLVSTTGLGFYTVIKKQTRKEMSEHLRLTPNYTSVTAASQKESDRVLMFRKNHQIFFMSGCK